MEFDWCNDTTFVTSQNQFVPELVCPLDCFPGLVHHTIIFVYFLKLLIPLIGSKGKFHTRTFNTLSRIVFHDEPISLVSVIDRCWPIIYAFVLINKSMVVYKPFLNEQFDYLPQCFCLLCHPILYVQIPLSLYLTLSLT